MKIIVRDANRFNHFNAGICSCGDSLRDVELYLLKDVQSIVVDVIVISSQES